MRGGKKILLLFAIAGGAICGSAFAQTQVVQTPKSGNSSSADAHSQSYLEFTARQFSVAYGLDEPVFVDLQIVNPEPGPASIDLGADGKADLLVTIREPSGRSESIRLPSGGLRSPGKHTLGANSTYTQRLNLSEWHEFRDVGGYAVNVALVPQFGPKPDHTLTAYFGVRIGPRDESRLRAVAKALADQAINARDGRERDAAALALSTVADPVAIPEMARVLASGSQAGLRLITPLARMGGPAAADALQAAARSNPDKWIRLDAARELQAMREGKQVVFEILD